MLGVGFPPGGRAAVRCEVSACDYRSYKGRRKGKAVLRRTESFDERWVSEDRTMEELGGYGSAGGGGGGGGDGSHGAPGRGGGKQQQQQHSSAASAAAVASAGGGGGGRSKVQGWSSLTRLHRNPPTSSPPRDPFPPLATCSFSSKSSKNSRPLNNLLASPIFGDDFHRPQQSGGGGLSSGGSFSSNLQGRNSVPGGATSIQNGVAHSSNGRGAGGGVEADGGVVVGETDERRIRRVGYGGSDSSSSSSDSFASNSFGQNGHHQQQGGGGAGGAAAAAAAGSTAGNYYQHGQSARSPPVSSAASHNNRVQSGGAGAGAGAGPGLSPGPFGSGFPSSSGIVVSNQVLQHSGREAGASKHERALELSADAAPFVPAVKRGSYDQALPQLGGAGEAEPSVLRDHSNALDHNIEGHFHHRDLGGRNENRDTAVASENREPERPSVSDCRSSTGDAERDANGEAGAFAYDHGRDGGDSTAASSAFYVPMEPEWEEDDLYLRYRSDALRTARERDRFARGASQAYIRGDHRRAKTMSKQAQERRLLAERLNAEAANEILNQRNNDASRNIWHIDLHGLHTGEAVAALENRLMYIESEIHSSGQTNRREGFFVPQIEHEVGETSNLRAHQDALKHKHTQSLITAPRELLVITGVGVHSQGGPTIPFAVKNFLLTKGYQFAQNTPGSFSVRPKLRLSV
ncbi:hypothetical protein Mapa_004000 [Marchantia paleacea]|nr:hypothetical protein Mapa_004000 [Marchantia paleacea]